MHINICMEWSNLIAVNQNLEKKIIGSIMKH